MSDSIEGLLGPQTGKAVTTNLGVRVPAKVAQLEASRTTLVTSEPKHFTTASTLNEIVSALLAVGELRKNQTSVVVVDEFDRISSEVERGRFADFIKQLGDQRVPVRFVFCGVAESMHTLLGAHGSCYRYLEEVELKNLDYGARLQIIDSVANALHVKIVDRPRWRIAAISDGFPYYIHRMCEQILWEMFDDPRPCVSPTVDHFRAAVASSVAGIEQHLRQTYDQAVMRDSDGFEEVLWATADHSDLVRKIESIYESYLRIMETSEGSPEALDRDTVAARLRALKAPNCGSILASQRKGYYHFRESIMRGYVRLRAEEQGCELALEYAAATNHSPISTWKPRYARRGRVGTHAGDWKKLQMPE